MATSLLSKFFDFIHFSGVGGYYQDSKLVVYVFKVEYKKYQTGDHRIYAKIDQNVEGGHEGVTFKSQWSMEKLTKINFEHFKITLSNTLIL